MEQMHWGLLGLFLYVLVVVLVLVDLGTKSSRCHQQTVGPISHFSLNWDVHNNVGHIVHIIWRYESYDMMLRSLAEKF